MDFGVKFDASHSQNSSVPSNSSENFQKFMYDLFEKNGILNNLRAHLRCHIIDVLKWATNENQPISIPKNFKKHLEPHYQALNILLAEYLLKMELNYSLSVFVSEIPLANMPFGFAKLLMKKPEEEIQAQKLNEDDIIAVLNCLGVQCNSDLICQVMGQYKNTDFSLLQCILQSLTNSGNKYRNFDEFQPSNMMSHSSSSLKSSDFEKNKHYFRSESPTCNHLRKCSVCVGKIDKLKEKYTDEIRQYKKKTTTDFSRDYKQYNVDVLEKRLIDEMFQEIRSVYEGELQILKSGEEKRIHASIANHAIALKKRIVQLEDQYHQKETQLQSDVRDKKLLLRSLMDSIQHEHQLATKTIQNINQEANKLAEKEEQMKKQIQEAENFIKQRSQEMTKQIQSELETLVTHLRSLKEEKQYIAKEKTELENLRKYCERHPLPESRVNDLPCRDPGHILVTNQLKKLKCLMESLGLNKNMKERSTLTELNDVSSKLNVMLNNEQEVVDERPTSFKVTPNKVFNQFRKEKNINFAVSDPEETKQGVCTSDSHRHIREENENLRSIAAEQTARIQQLSSEVTRAQNSLVSPNTVHATVFQPFNVQLQRLSAMPGCSNASGGGEELNAFRSRPVSAPAVAVPFMGFQQEPHCSRPRTTRPIHKQSKPRRGLSHDKVLQEARRTLRNLEIEAEAVHNSYVEFKRKQEARSDAECGHYSTDPTPPLNSKNTAARDVVVMTGSVESSPHSNLFKRLSENVRLVSPIPEDYGALRPPRERTRNHIETPLNEFRKLYNSNDKSTNQKKSSERFNRGVYINDEKVVSTTNLEVPDDQEQSVTASNDSKGSYDKTKVTNVYTCGVVNDVKNKCAEICLPMRDILTSNKDEPPRLIKLEIENLTNFALIESPPQEPFIFEIESGVDTNEVEIVTIKPSDTEMVQDPNSSADIVNPMKDNSEKQNYTNNNSPTITNYNRPTSASLKSNGFDVINNTKNNERIEKLKIESEDYQNEDFEESSSDENVSVKSEPSPREKPRLNTIDEEDKSDAIIPFLSNTSNDLDAEDEYPDDFTDIVGSGDSPRSIAKQFTDNDSFWQN